MLNTWILYKFYFFLVRRTQNILPWKKRQRAKALPFKYTLAFFFVSSAKEAEMMTTWDSVKGIGVDSIHLPSPKDEVFSPVKATKVPVLGFQELSTQPIQIFKFVSISLKSREGTISTELYSNSQWQRE